MKLAELNRNYFTKGTRGYTIISKYYYKYQDLFEKTIFPDFKDFIHQIFLNISGINFTEEIKNPEAYVIGTIKIQCRVQLDKSIKLKNVIPESRLLKNNETEEVLTFKLPSQGNNPVGLLDTQEMFIQINMIKLQLKQPEKDLLNLLIDETPRLEIAGELNLNLNTLDTNIRRLRVKIAEYFKNLGYSSDLLDKFQK